jgi:NAD(P)H dehydrogenase (quinone)
MSYAITGASGQLGRLATETLLGLVDPNDVILITRDPGRLDDHDARARRGVTVRVGDFDQPETLAAAFAGVEGLLMLEPFSPSRPWRAVAAARSGRR